MQKNIRQIFIIIYEKITHVTKIITSIDFIKE